MTDSSGPTAPEPGSPPSKRPTAVSGRIVERSIAWLTHGNRKVHYRGITKNDHWLAHRAAALNQKRLLALGPHRAAALNRKRLLALGPHRAAGTWVMATA